MSQVAERIAARIPRSHFPASAKLSSWSKWNAQAVLPGCLQPEAGPEPEDAHDNLRWRHAFLFAGPACFASAGEPVGDGVMYFAPAVDGTLRGHACPFDTGSCKPAVAGGRLQPFANGDTETCLDRILQSSAELSGWRAELRDWLEHCYDTPERYLESDGDRWTDGEPDRTRPPELLEHNGRRGRARGSTCADRRAWTWEVRTTQPVGFEHVAAVHVLTHRVDAELLDEQNEMEQRLGTRIRVLAVDPKLSPSGPTSLYEDSGRVLRLLLESEAT